MGIIGKHLSKKELLNEEIGDGDANNVRRTCSRSRFLQDRQMILERVCFSLILGTFPYGDLKKEET